MITVQLLQEKGYMCLCRAWGAGAGETNVLIDKSMQCFIRNHINKCVMI